MEEPSDELKIAIEDGKLAVEVFKKALHYRPFIKEAIVGQAFLSLAEQERWTETTTRRIGLTYVDQTKTIPILFFRFVGDVSPVVEAFFYPYEAILAFLSDSRAYARWIKPEGKPQEIDEIAFEKSVEMTLIMIDSFYGRGELMMDSFTSEVIAAWHLHNWQNVFHYQAERGEMLSPPKRTSLENAVKSYTKSVLQLWKHQGQTYENWQKIRLAEEYDAIKSHWKLLSKMSVENENWRDYAKPNKFQDTPDDLLDRLENTDRLDSTTVDNKVSNLALEHASRRARLIKKTGVSDSILERRKKGIKVTGYSSGQLFEHLKEGRELVAKQKAQDELIQEQGTVPTEQEKSAQLEKAKSLKQKVDFVLAEDKKSSEQNDVSAQAKKVSK